MPVTASGPISLPLEYGRILVANCAAFRSWGGASSVAKAMERIHLVDVPPPEGGGSYSIDELEALRPYVTIDQFALPGSRQGGDGWMSVRRGQGAFVDGGKLLLRFFDNVPPEDQHNAAEARLLFMNRLGGVLQEMKLKGGGDGVDADGNPLLSVHGMSIWEPFRRAFEDEVPTMGDFYACGVAVTWGP
jgi:hypothetical protein